MQRVLQLDHSCFKPRGIYAACATVGSFPFHSHLDDEQNLTAMEPARREPERYKSNIRMFYDEKTFLMFKCRHTVEHIWETMGVGGEPEVIHEAHGGG